MKRCGGGIYRNIHRTLDRSSRRKKGRQGVISQDPPLGLPLPPGFESIFVLGTIIVNVVLPVGSANFAGPFPHSRNLGFAFLRIRFSLCSIASFVPIRDIVGEFFRFNYEYIIDTVTNQIKSNRILVSVFPPIIWKFLVSCRARSTFSLKEGYLCGELFLSEVRSLILVTFSSS